MYLGKSFEVILKEHEINPIYYDDTMNDVYTHFLEKDYGGRVRILVILM